MTRAELKERDRNLQFEFFNKLCAWAGNEPNHHITKKNIIDFAEAGEIEKISDPDLQKVFRNYYEDTQIGDIFETQMDRDENGVCTYEEFSAYVEWMLGVTDIYDE